MDHDENANDMAVKYYKTIQNHLKNEDISKALTCLRTLTEMAESRKGLNRPMIQMQAAKALLEVHKQMAELEIKANAKPDSHVTNIYNTIPEDREKDDAITISRRLNIGLSKSVKR